MAKLLSVIFILIISVVSKAQSIDTLSLWDNTTAPTSNGIVLPQAGKGVYWENVTSAVLTVYRPEKPNGLAVIACPGGSYLQVWEREFHNIAKWYKSSKVERALSAEYYLKRADGFSK